ncbi:DUF6660 family protein [Chitinophaga deserti]|uniref:DUF6660 family protein n=1 Tax=Chitinophaga deserti TaxID=2164099 RepID=UPI0013002834|nr:DUF6660 family protein [Chitinophaga deserti]
MKALCLFLSFWILLCAGTPCSDGAPHDHEETSQTAVHLPVTEHANCFDLCSPFCACYCCAVSVSLPHTTLYFSRTAALPVVPEVFVCPPVRDYPNAPWQPPRVS